MASMRCLDTTTFELHARTHRDFVADGYAILSHRWGAEEVLFAHVGHFAGELRRTKGRHVLPQLDKILGACATTRARGIRWVWVDSCCIDKSDQAELSEAINSMFRWYSDALVCLTILDDVRRAVAPTPPASAGVEIFHTGTGTGEVSKWFTRGWTLQELLAPSQVLFYDAGWELLGCKKELAAPLEQVTGVAARYLTGDADFRDACIAAKLSWLSHRVTTREEDVAYSMLGIFNVNLSVQYGEGGTAAFMRLQEALVAKNDESLFAWKMPPEGPGPSHRIKPDSAVDLGPDEWGLLAPSPAWCAHCGAMTTDSGKKKKVMRHRGGFTRTPQGISGPISKRQYYTAAFLSGLTVVGAIPFQIWIAVREHTTLKYSLNCWEPDESGVLRAVRIHLRPVRRDPQIYIRTSSQTYDLVRSVTKVNYSAVGTVWQPELY